MKRRPPSRNTIRIQVTLDADVHPRLASILGPLNRWQRKERLVALAYQGLVAEGAVHACEPAPASTPAPVRSRAIDRDKQTEWTPQIDGDVYAALGIDPM